ncbi:MAG: ABC transporter substrate-binding protein [Chloroflexi bacterium]|nr:ABC transporter substrate-binding protein [Chloroflexota bacterium]
MYSNKLRGLIAVGLVATFVLVGCSKAAPATTTATTAALTTTKAAATTPAGPYGELVIGVTSFGTERLKLDSISGDSLGLLAPLTDFLFWTESYGGAQKPQLVEKWDISADGLSWTYNIRKGIKFHNGDTLTAKDVKFSIEQNLSKTAFFNNTNSSIESVEVVDDYTVRILTKGKQPLLPRIHTGTSPYQGIVVPKDYIDKNGWDYFEQHPVGTGPFKFVSRTLGDSFTYQAVDKHWRQTADFATLKVVMIPEEATRVAALKTGQIDVAENLDFSNAIGLEKLGTKLLEVGQAASMIQLHGAYEPRAKGMPTSDLRVRQALSMAIDRAEIAKTLYFGKAQPPLPPYFSSPSVDIDMPFWTDYLSKIYRYDPAEATRLLKDAGYQNGFTIKLYTFPAGGAPDNPKLALIAQSYWAKIGVKTEIVPSDDGTYKKWKNKPVNDALVGQATTYVAVSLPPTNLKSHFYGKSGTNLLGESSPEFDRLIDAVFNEMDEAKRKDLFGQATKIVTDAYTSLMIDRYPAYAALGDKVTFGLPTPQSTQVLSVYAQYFKHKK